MTCTPASIVPEPVIMSSRFSLPSAVANRSKNDVIEALDRLEAYKPRDPTDLMLSAVPERASLPVDVDWRLREAKGRRQAGMTLTCDNGQRRLMTLTREHGGSRASGITTVDRYRAIQIARDQDSSTRPVHCSP